MYYREAEKRRERRYWAEIAEEEGRFDRWWRRERERRKRRERAAPGRASGFAGLTGGGRVAKAETWANSPSAPLKVSFHLYPLIC